jgi:hypothetical protein
MSERIQVPGAAGSRARSRPSTARGLAVVVIALSILAGCSDDPSDATIETDVGALTVSVREDQVCVDGEALGGSCGERPDADDPVTYGVSGGGPPGSNPAYVMGFAIGDVVSFDLETDDQVLTPELHDIESAGWDGLQVWAVEIVVDIPPDPEPSETMPDIRIENVETK